MTAGSSQMSLRQHTIAFFSGGVLTATRLIAGFLRVKYLALALGTAGLGVLSQAAQTQLLLVSLGSLAIARGLITRIGVFEAARDRERDRRLLSTALTVQLGTSLLLVLGIAVGSDYVVGWLFPGETMTAAMYLPVLLSVPLSVVATGYAEAVLMGGHRFDLYVRASMVMTVLGAVATVGAVWLWGLAGGLLGILATSSIHCAVTLVYSLKIRSSRELFRLGFDGREARILVRFSFVMLAVAAAGYVARLWIQSRVIGALGVEANGLLHVPLAMTSYYTPLLTNPLWGRLHPSVSRTGDTLNGRRELSVALAFTVAVTTFIVVTILALKEILVRVAYSAAFLPAAELLPAQLMGDYFYFIALTFGVYAMGAGKLRAYFGAWVGYYVLSALAATLLLPTLGLQAVAVGYGISAIALAVPSLIWLWARGGGAEGRAALSAVAAGSLVTAGQTVLAFKGIYWPLQALVVVTTGGVCLFYFVLLRDGAWGAGARAVPAAEIVVDRIEPPA